MIRLNLSVFVALVILSPAGLTAQQKPAPGPADYGKWESLSAAVLAPNGRWFAYTIDRVNEENELRVRGIEREAVHVFAYGSAPAFSADSRWLAFSIGVSPQERERLEDDEKPVRNRAGILNLASGDTVTVAAIASHRFSADGRFIALRGYPPEERETADLFVRELATGRTLLFGNVTDFAWAEIGPLLALTVRTESGSGNGVQLYDAATGALRVLDSSSSLYRAPAWRDHADDLAVLRSRIDPGFRDTTHIVLAWTRLQSPAPVLAQLDPASAPGIPADMRVAEHRVPEWSEDGTALYIGLRPRARAAAQADSARAAEGSGGGGGAAADTTATRGATTDSGNAEKRSDVQVWHARDIRIMPMQKVQEQQDLRRTLLAVWHLGDSGRVVPIGTDLLETASVLEGGRFATETDSKPYSFGAMFGRPADDIWLVDLQTGERSKVLEGVRHYYGASAAGRYLLSFDGKDFWTYDVERRQRANLTAAQGGTFHDTDEDHPVEQLPPWGLAGWTTNDRALLVYDEYDVWSVAPDGSGGQRLTDGAAERVVHRYARTGGDDEGIDVSKPIYFSLVGKTSKKSGYARLRPGRSSERLVFEDARVSRLLRADSAAVFAFTRERFDDSPDYFAGGPDLKDARPITQTNPFQKDYAWGRAELIDFTSATGRKLQAALLYPADFDQARKYPMIVYTYELLSQDVHRYVVPSERSYYNFSVFTANGYFVLMPDIVYRGRDPGRSALAAVEPAVQAIIDRGLVDPARIGLVGHSWGGYQATYLPTQTNIFAASVAGAPITNFLSFAGAIHWRPGFPELDHWETGQARMDVAPWEDFDAHVRNSPAAFVQKLETPMLMTFGDADGTVDWHQGIEFYNFARRAGKQDFVMLVYPGEDHGLRKKENQIDYHRRILQWFGHWLKGDEAPEWMTSGVTWLERKKLLEGEGK